METEKWIKLAKIRFAKAKERPAKSEARFTYLGPDAMLFIHAEMKQPLEL